MLIVRVCLSALLCWAWLQGNSRARRLRSAVPALPGFGFPLRLPGSPFAKLHHSHPPLARNQHELEEKGSNEYKTRTEWHRILCWNKLADWAGTLQKGAYVEIEGELRYRDYTPAEADRSVRVAEVHAHSILALDRSERQPVSATASERADEPLD